MARVISSKLRHISGRIGDHIFYAVGDKRYVRRAPIKVSNPRSPAQCLQRWRQGCVQTLFRSVKGTLFQRAAGEAAVQLGKRSGYHLFLSRNINAFGEGDRVDYAKLSFGGACLQLPDRFACVQNETGHWELVWQAGIPMATAAPDDRLIVAAICPDEPYRLIVLENICALRKDGVENIVLPLKLDGQKVNGRQAGRNCIYIVCFALHPEKLFRRIAISD